MWNYILVSIIEYGIIEGIVYLSRGLYLVLNLLFIVFNERFIIRLVRNVLLLFIYNKLC